MRSFFESIPAVVDLEAITAAAMRQSPTTDPALMAYRYRVLFTPVDGGWTLHQDRRRPNDYQHIIGKLKELRGIAAQDKSPYFVAYCVAVVPGEAIPGRTREDRVKSAWGIETPDAPKTLLERLSDLPHRFVPASECMKTNGDYDVVLRSTKKRPALLVGVGPTQVISPDRAQVDVFTTSGGLTETVTAYSLARGRDGRWRITGEEILLQV